MTWFSLVIESFSYLCSVKFAESDYFECIIIVFILGFILDFINLGQFD